MNHNRRVFLGASAGALAAGLTSPGALASQKKPKATPRPSSDRLRIGAIGMRYQGSVITEKALPYGDLVAICDVDRHLREMARSCFGGRAKIYEDYRDLLRHKGLDVVLIGTPDHWHTKMVIDACKAGLDIYCEKPLTLTIDEGKLLCKVVKQTGRVVQVGTWQRSDVRFRQACEMVRAGCIGKLRKVTCATSPNPTGGPFENVPQPKHINWDLWQGQTPAVPYCEERCHYTFRWWYEYSGGKMTDWGAHHLDIAQWGIGSDRTGPVHIDGKGKHPDIPNGYNVSTWFNAKMAYANGVELEISCEGKDGVLFEGTEGSIYVTRGKIVSKPAGLLAERAFPREQYKLYAQDLSFEPKVGKLQSIENHMRNFFDCVRTRGTPISDVVSQHRSVSVCHLANISLRLGRPLQWDPEQELFVGDKEANTWLSREQRKGFEITA